MKKKRKRTKPILGGICPYFHIDFKSSSSDLYGGGKIQTSRHHVGKGPTNKNVIPSMVANLFSRHLLKALTHKLLSEEYLVEVDLMKNLRWMTTK